MEAETCNTHDFSCTTWGWDYTFTPVDKDLKGSATGWGYGISAGDYLILKNGEDGTTRYRVMDIKYFLDPADMWTANLEFAPRQPTPTERE